MTLTSAERLALRALYPTPGEQFKGSMRTGVSEQTVARAMDGDDLSPAAYEGATFLLARKGRHGQSVIEAVRLVMDHHRIDYEQHVEAAIACATGRSDALHLLEPDVYDLYRAVRLTRPRTEPLPDLKTIADNF